MARCKVLSTRRLDPSLAEQAKKGGMELEETDFICIRPVRSDAVARQIQPWIEKEAPSFVVFTSANGVAAVMHYLEKAGTLHTPNWKVFCISGKTREALAAALPGAAVVATAQYGSHLAQLILQHSDIKEVVFFCGDKRLEALPALLGEAGIRVHEIVVYHTEEVHITTREDLDGVLFFSPSAVSSFFAANQLKGTTVCFAIGTTTADALARYTTNKIITPSSASQAAMLEAVQHYFQRIN